MFAPESVLEHALETIRLEAEAVTMLMKYIDVSFVKAVQVIHEAKGRVVMSGIGKSAVIAQKITATFNSTGTPSLFMHAADAIHGDLGMIQPDDVVVIISKSGNSPEIKVLVPLVKSFGNTVIAICGNESSYLATNAHITLNTTVEKEACPHNLAPTTSTTAQMVMGDALAVCLLKLKGFTERDFARYHPGGALGKRLYLRVGDMSNQNEKPLVQPGSTLREVIFEISGKMLGATVVASSDGSIAGIVTDGDLRRMLEKHENPGKLTAGEIMTPSPKCIDAGELATEALSIMRANDINQLVVTRNGKYAGILHIHDLVREGLL